MSIVTRSMYLACTLLMKRVFSPTWTCKSESLGGLRSVGRMTGPEQSVDTLKSLPDLLMYSMTSGATSILLIPADELLEPI